MRGASSVTPIGRPSGRSTSYSTASPPGNVADRTNCSSAVKNSQSRKSSSARPLTVWSSVPGTSPSAAPSEPGATRVGHKARYGDLDGEQRIDLDQVLEGRVPSAAQVPGRREQSDRAPIQRVELHETLRHREQVR